MLVVISRQLELGLQGRASGLRACFVLYAGLRLGFKGDDMTTQVGLGAHRRQIRHLRGTDPALLATCATSLRYFFVKMEHHDYIDDETQIGNKRFLLKELTSRIDENERYEVPFSLVAFTIDQDFLEQDQGGPSGASILRDISTSILKNDTRSVDELARLDNQLVVILPCVRRDGANVCCKRLESKMQKIPRLALHQRRVGDGPECQGLRVSGGPRGHRVHRQHHPRRHGRRRQKQHGAG